MNNKNSFYITKETNVKPRTRRTREHYHQTQSNRNKEKRKNSTSAVWGVGNNKRAISQHAQTQSIEKHKKKKKKKQDLGSVGLCRQERDFIKHNQIQKYKQKIKNKKNTSAVWGSADKRAISPMHSPASSIASWFRV